MMELNYKLSESTVKPDDIEFGKNTVYIRKNIGTRTDPNTGVVFWTYQEATLTHAEFLEYTKLMEAKKALYDENQMIIMEAIADLYDKIAEM